MPLRSGRIHRPIDLTTARGHCKRDLHAGDRVAIGIGRSHCGIYRDLGSRPHRLVVTPHFIQPNGSAWRRSRAVPGTGENEERRRQNRHHYHSHCEIPLSARRCAFGGGRKWVGVQERRRRETDDEGKLLSAWPAPSRCPIRSTAPSGSTWRWCDWDREAPNQCGCDSCTRPTVASEDSCQEPRCS